jgi:4-hydroxybenzoate polyprenyltransferase
MFLNDAFDVEFDRMHRKERPIPAGAIQLPTVWTWGCIWLAAGMTGLFVAGMVTGVLGLVLTLCIVSYDALHKRISLAPALMGLCRFLLYPIAASTADATLSRTAIGGGVALAIYVIGISFLARRESLPGAPRYWPIALLAAPIALALLTNAPKQPDPVFLLSAVVGLWIARCLRSTLQASERNIGRTVSGLLAGIVFVDWLAVAGAPRQFGAVFIALFLTALLLQKVAPAT